MHSHHRTLFPLFFNVLITFFLDTLLYISGHFSLQEQNLLHTFIKMAKFHTKQRQAHTLLSWGMWIIYFSLSLIHFIPSPTFIFTTSMYHLVSYSSALYLLIPSLLTSVIHLIYLFCRHLSPLILPKLHQFRVSPYPSILNVLDLSLCIDFPCIRAKVPYSSLIRYYLNICLPISVQEFSKKKVNKHCSRELQSDFDVNMTNG
jgi:hypothetical protein